MTLKERLDEDKENTVDRRLVSSESKRKLSEAIYHDDVEGFETEVFNILTGDLISEWKPWRDIEGKVVLSDSVEEKLTEEQRVVLNIAIGEKDSRSFVSIGEEGSYRQRELQDGEYEISVENVVIREDDDDGLDSTEIKVESYDYTVDSIIEIDTENQKIGNTVEAPKIELTNIELEDDE